MTSLQATLERVLSRVTVDPLSGCWVSGHATNNKGYAVVKHGGRSGRLLLAHRLSYAVANGLTLEELDATGLVLDHVQERGCVSTACVNPEHLELVTQRVNCHRANGSAWQLAAAKTRCVRNHALTGANLSPAPLRAGHRQCLTCKRGRSRIESAEKFHGVLLTWDDVVPAVFAKYPEMARDACPVDTGPEPAKLSTRQIGDDNE